MIALLSRAELLRALVLALTLLLFACVTSAVTSRAYLLEHGVRVEIENRNWLAINVRIYCNGGQRKKVSQVVRSRSFMMLLEDCYRVSYKIETIGSEASYVPQDDVLVHAGNTLRIWAGHDPRLVHSGHTVLVGRQ